MTPQNRIPIWRRNQPPQEIGWKSNSAIVFASSLFALAALTGCGANADQGDRPETIPASGSVTLDGSPVVDATVTFNPEAHDGTAAFAKTDNEGQFKLTSFEEGDGAVAGNYIVTITKFSGTAPPAKEADENSYVPPGAPGYKPPEKPKNALPNRYAQMHTSNLKAVIAAGSSESFEFELQK